MEQSGNTRDNVNANTPLTHCSAEGEILRIGGLAGPATLSVLCGAQNEATAASITSGDFVLTTVTKPGTPFALLACSVQDHYWLLAPDSAVLRVGPRKFVFAFPGFFYALSLPHGCFDHDVQRLDVVLERLPCYQNHAGNRDADFAPRRERSDFWVSAYEKISTLSSLLLPQVVPNFDIARVLQTSVRSSMATSIILKVFKVMNQPLQSIAIAGPFSAVSAIVYPSICIVADVVEALHAPFPETSAGAGARLSQASRWSQLACGRITCWHFNAAGISSLLESLFYEIQRARVHQRSAAGGSSGSGSSASAAGALPFVPPAP